MAVVDMGYIVAETKGGANRQTADSRRQTTDDKRRKTKDQDKSLLVHAL
jgi:hypothetical protein